MQTEGNKTKMNIRKIVAIEKKKTKTRYKTLRLQAIDTPMDIGKKLREREQVEWDKFKFLSNLGEALDKVDK